MLSNYLHSLICKTFYYYLAFCSMFETRNWILNFYVSNKCKLDGGMQLCNMHSSISQTSDGKIFCFNFAIFFTTFKV